MPRFGKESPIRLGFRFSKGRLRREHSFSKLAQHHTLLGRVFGEQLHPATVKVLHLAAGLFKLYREGIAKGLNVAVAVKETEELSTDDKLGGERPGVTGRRLAGHPRGDGKDND